MTLILSTKLYIPPVRPALVPRPHLIERLNGGLDRKLTLISAPAGFGKTTLLSEWAAACDRPVAWLSLDEGDNNPTRFWTYLIAALQTIQADVGQATLSLLQTPQQASLESLLTGLVNEVVQVSAPFALVLDDLQVITDQRVNEALAFWLDNMPSRMHLILSSRADPPWPLGRMRARGDLTELRAPDLRFTSQEATRFLNETMELGLSPEDVAALESRTEGWIAGLQMASLAMQGRLARRGRQDLSGFIRAFGGSHRFVLDYLAEEVLEAQPDDIQDFLFKTSILQRMAAPLCAAVTDREESQAILTRLEQANLFLIPLDDQRRWYRYHHLFADLLRSRLREARPEQLTDLYGRASAWYEKKGLITEAVRYALAAGEIEQVARLVEGHALAMMGHGELTTVTAWLDALPGAMVRARPWLSIARAWALLYGGQLGAVEPLLKDAEAAANPLRAQGASGHVDGHIAAIQAEVAYVRGEMSHAAALAQKALELLPMDDSMAQGFAAAHLAYALYWRGELAAADEALVAAYAIARKTGDSHVAVMVLCDLATVQIDRGQLDRAVATLERALQLADQHAGRGGQRPPSSGHAYTYMAHVLLERNDLTGALRCAQEGNALCRLWRQPETLASSYHSLARVLQATGDGAGAVEAIQEASRLAAALSPWIAARVSAWEALIRLAGGDLQAADRWRQKSGLHAGDRLDFQHRFLYRTLAKILIGLGREEGEGELLDQAAGLLSRLVEMAEATGARGYAIGVLVLQAMALQAQNKIEQALGPLKRAIDLAGPAGYVRTIIDEGQPMGQLLRRAVAQGIMPAYAGQLLAALEDETGKEWRASPSGDASLVEALSERELEVLRLLTTHLSSTQIAEELYISANTVRSHIKNIYSKLNVHSRKEAVQRAWELELL